MRPGGGYVPNFQLFEKGDVNGENEQKIFSFLKVSKQTAWINQPGFSGSNGAGVYDGMGLLKESIHSHEALASSRGNIHGSSDVD